MELKVISFNIRCADDSGGNSIKERAPRLAGVTFPYDADVLGFQEYTPKWKPHIQKYYGSDYDIFNKYRTRFIRRESSPILWKKDKFKCVDNGYFWLSDTPHVQSRGWDEKYNCHRICEYVVLKDKKIRTLFTLMNTHFGFGDNGQIKSADLIYQYSKKISPYPTIVTGDFNLTPQMPGYDAMAGHFTDADMQKDHSPTYHGYYKKNTIPMHIDYCFCDDRVVPLEYKIIKDLPDGKFPSDHYGIFAKLII